MVATVVRFIGRRDRFSRTVPRFEKSSLSEGAPTALSGSTGQAIAEEDTITHNAAISAYENVAEQSGDWIHSGVGALAMFGVMGQPYTNTCYAATCAGAGSRREAPAGHCLFQPP